MVFQLCLRVAYGCKECRFRTTHEGYGYDQKLVNFWLDTVGLVLVRHQPINCLAVCSNVLRLPGAL